MGLPVEPPPNKRLKLPGGYRSKGNGVLCAGAHKLSFNNIALGGRVARSLSATVRQPLPFPYDPAESLAHVCARCRADKRPLVHDGSYRSAPRPAFPHLELGDVHRSFELPARYS